MACERESLQEKEELKAQFSETNRKDCVRSTGYTSKLEIRKTAIPLRSNYLHRDLSIQL